ncbi:potassium transporter TrkH, partial [Halomonas sp. ND22Bw]
ILGMGPFDALAHALTSIATGGFSTSDRSFGAWSENGIQWFGALFMLAGAVPFVLYVRFIAGDRRAFFDRQVRTLLT